MKPKKGKPFIEYPDGISDPEELSHGSLTVVSNLSGQEHSRPKEELKRGLKEQHVASVEDACRKFDVRLEGRYIGPDGEAVDVSVPVTDESTFTPDGLTRSDPGLFRLFVEAETCDQLAKYLDDHERDYLTQEEIEHLQSAVEILEKSVEGDE